MSLYVIEDRYGALRDSSVNYNYAKSLQQSRYPDGHIVELVPAKPKVQVSQEEADMLEKAKHHTIRPSFAITEYSDSHKGYILGNDLEDRLMNAYVNGYTVKKESRYMVYVPGTNKKFLYNKRGDSSTRAAKLETPIVPSPVTSYQTAYGQYKPLYWFTDAEITKFGLQDCEKVKATDYEKNDCEGKQL